MALLSCDVCIVLDEPGGVAEQIAHLTGSGHAHKLYVLSPQENRARNKFPAVLQEYGNQEFFNDSERGVGMVDRMFQWIEHVATRKALGDEEIGGGNTHTPASRISS